MVIPLALVFSTLCGASLLAAHVDVRTAFYVAGVVFGIGFGLSWAGRRG